MATNPTTPTRPLATPGAAATTPTAPDRMGIPTQPSPGTTQAAKPSAPTDAGAPAKTTEPLKGTLEQQMAALMARQTELEQANRDLHAQLRSKAEVIQPAKPLPTVAEAQAMLDNAETAVERKPILTEKGWLVHTHAFEQPNADAAKFLQLLGKSLPPTAAAH